MERSLAHIETISWIKPIEGADKIELCGVLGWQCVIAKKDNFKVGDKIIYVEIDSVMLPKPEFEFLKDRNYRVKTIKLRGMVSQGLVLPLSSLNGNCKSPDEYSIGEDVTELLGVTKYLTPSERNELYQEEKVIKNGKNKLKKFMMKYSWFRKLVFKKKQSNEFPSWFSKSDETRIQSLNWDKFYEAFKDKEVYITEKVDGQNSNFTSTYIPNNIPIIGKYLPKKWQFIVASRNLINNDKDSLYWKVARKYNIEQILKENPTLTIQGEQCDTKVQGNKYKVTEPMFWVFNIIDHEKNYHYSIEEMQVFCQNYNLNLVPILNNTVKGSKDNIFPKLSDIGSTVEDFLEFSKGKSILADIQREGVVIRCIENGKKLLSFKVINNDFLLKYND